jgi:hypothetical protein
VGKETNQTAFKGTLKKVESVFYVDNQKNFEDEIKLNVVSYENETSLPANSILISKVKKDELVSNPYRKDSNFVKIYSITRNYFNLLLRQSF